MTEIDRGLSQERSKCYLKSIAAKIRVLRRGKKKYIRKKRLEKLLIIFISASSEER